MTVASLTKLTALALALVLITSVGAAQAVEMDISSNVGAGVQFTGSNNTFTFDNDAQADFTITDSNETLLEGLTGSINDTGFTIGPILGFGAFQTADVQGTGTFSINDGSGGVLTGDVSWIQIYTFGASGAVNVGGDVNLTNLDYTPTSAATSNPALAGLENGGGTVVVSFQFAAPQSLTQLTGDTSSVSTSYSGSVSAVPEPGTLILLGTGLAGAAGFGLRRRRQK